MNKIIRFSVFAVFILLSAVSIYMEFYAEELIEALADKIGSDGDSEKIKSFLTGEKIQLLFGFSTLAALSIGFLFLFRFERITILWNSFFREFYQKLRGLKSAVSTREALTVTSIILVHLVLSIYHASQIPVTNDEAFTYLNYVNRGFVAAFAFYNEPNNHILYSLLANCSDLLSFMDISWRLRLPSLLIGAISTFSFYWLFRKLYGIKRAQIFTIIWIGLFLVAKYHFLARGYGLMMLSFITAFYAIISLKEDPKSIFAKGFFICAVFIGLYAHPTFVIPLIPLIIFSWSDREIQITTILKLLIPAMFITVIFYAPPIILNGFDAFTQNSGLEKPSFHRLLKEIGENIWGVVYQASYKSLFASGVITGLAIVSIISNRKSAGSRFLLSSIISILIILLAVGSPMFTRNLLWLSVPIVMLFAQVLKNDYLVPKKRFSIVFASVTILFFTVRATSFNPTFDSYYDRLQPAYDFADALPSEYGELFFTNTKYHYTILKYKANLIDHKKGTLQRNHFDPSMKYDFIVNEKEKDQAFQKESNFNYELYYENDLVSVWALNE
jgi:hypothetical protein